MVTITKSEPSRARPLIGGGVEGGPGPQGFTDLGPSAFIFSKGNGIDVLEDVVGARSDSVLSRSPRSSGVHW